MFHSLLGRAVLIGAGAAVAAAAAIAAVIYSKMKNDIQAEAEDYADEVEPKAANEGTTELDDENCCPEKFTEPVAANDDAVAYDTDGDGEADTFCLDTDGDGQVDTVLTDTDGDGKPDTAVIDVDGDGKFDTAAEIPQTDVDDSSDK
ncbi:MAG: hypothetical protein IJ072_02465 [Oscillospiraceae bacterium]|nr:hypothetical protein [Oscillospiraceae bacterium]